MTDEFERLLQATQGQPPSDDFVARLRAEIVAETAGRDPENEQIDVRTLPSTSEPAEDGVRDHDADEAVVLDVEPSPDRETTRPTRRAARRRRTEWLAAAAVLTVGSMGAWMLISDLDGDGQVVLDTPTSETPNLEDDDAGEPLTAGSTVVEPGRHRVDTLGTAFSFSVEDTTGVGLNENGVVTITDVTNIDGADDRTITFRRTSLLPAPAAPTAEIDPTSGWPATDLTGWLDATPDELSTSAPVDTTLGGLDATFVELEFGCDGENCVAGIREARPDVPMFTAGSRYRLWVVEQLEEDPIVVVVAIDDDDEAAWFGEADAILSSLQFESVEPNPVRRLGPGRAELAVFDGISLDLPSELVLVEPFDGFARILSPATATDVEFLTRPMDIDGSQVATTERLLQLLADEAVEVSELDAFDIGGVDARAFEVDSGPFPNVLLKTRPADLARNESGWESPHRGHLWVIEHPDRDLLMVTTETLDPEQLEMLRAWTEQLLGTLEFEGA